MKFVIDQADTQMSEGMFSRNQTLPPTPSYVRTRGVAKKEHGIQNHIWPVKSPNPVRNKSGKRNPTQCPLRMFLASPTNPRPLQILHPATPLVRTLLKTYHVCRSSLHQMDTSLFPYQSIYKVSCCKISTQ